MKELIKTYRCRYKLFRQPDQIGDVIEADKKLWLIIGIEKFELLGRTLYVWYTCQDLSKSDYLFKPTTASPSNEIELDLQLKFDDKRWEGYTPGCTVSAKDGNIYKLIEYTEVSLKSTDIYISIMAKQIHPVDRREAKTIFLNERKKKLKLEVH